MNVRNKLRSNIQLKENKVNNLLEEIRKIDKVDDISHLECKIKNLEEQIKETKEKIEKEDYQTDIMKYMILNRKKTLTHLQKPNSDIASILSKISNCIIRDQMLYFHNAEEIWRIKVIKWSSN